MNSLLARVLRGFVVRAGYYCVLLFGSARSFVYWQAWVYLTVFLAPTLMVALYFLKKNPEFLERRLKFGVKHETRACQKIIMLLIMFFASVTLAVSGLDRRFGWSRVPTALVMIADAAVLLGIFIQFKTFKENSFASATIGILPEQKVISTGPYALVRHPMYSGSLLAHVFTPIALGSWCALPLGLASVIVLGLRLRDEEKMLHQSLPGYGEYCGKVRWRLVPGVW